jgi:hypothetical protein
LSGPALRRVGKFTLRLAITYALLYAAWLPIDVSNEFQFRAQGGAVLAASSLS